MRSRGSRTAASSSTAADIGIGLVLSFLALYNVRVWFALARLSSSRQTLDFLYSTIYIMMSQRLLLVMFIQQYMRACRPSSLDQTRGCAHRAESTCT